jgi:hypothetical protein
MIFERMIMVDHSKMREFIENLSASEAVQVLEDLLNDTPDLTKTVYDIAVKTAVAVDADEIMEDVFCGLDVLDIDDLNSRTGRTGYGYVEPYDAAWDIFEEALKPFIDEMKKNQRRALPTAAKAHCIGIIKGLWKYEEESNSEFKDWVTDVPIEYIDRVVYEWKKGDPDDDDIAEVMSAAEGGWA